MESRKDYFDEDMIFLRVSSDGATGEEHVKRLEKLGFDFRCLSREIIEKHLKPTNGVEYEVVVMKGTLFEESERSVENIRKEAIKMGFASPNIEIACLLCEKFARKNSAINRILVISDDAPEILSFYWDSNGSYMYSYDVPDPSVSWDIGMNFAFVSSAQRVF